MKEEIEHTSKEQDTVKKTLEIFKKIKWNIWK